MLRSNVTAKSALSISLVLALSVPLYPCTVLFLPQSAGQVVAINMDWTTGQGLIFINKRNVHKQAAFVSGQTPLQWTSQYMSVSFTETGLEFPWEGMNEKGLSVHLLLSNSTVLPPASDPRPAVNGIQWVQYILDTSATTAQAITNAEATRVTGPFGALEHYFVCDANGNCAAFDYLNGQLSVTQGSQFPMVLTNDPYYLDYQNLSSMEAISSPAQIEALTGTDSKTRFAKAAMFSTQYTPQSEAVSYGFNALNSLTESDTQWRIVFSLANQTLQYRTTTATGLKYIDLQQFNPSCASGVQWHYLNALTSGDITSQFSNYSASANNVLIQANTGFSASTTATLEDFPSSTQCEETTTTLSANVKSSTLGQPVKLLAQVAGNGPALPTGTVAFWNGSNPLGTATLSSGGIAQISTSSLAAGSNPVTAVYAGDSLNLTSASPTLWQGVNVQPTQVALSSSLNPANVNQFVALTASLSGQAAGPPTGKVIFYDGPVALGTVSLNSQGVAQFASSGLIAGTHSISAIYSGDAQNASSTSGFLVETVSSQSTLNTLTSSINPSEVAQSNTFSAQISGADGVIPSGTVAFSFNGTVVPPIVRLQAGQANISKSLSTAGSRSIAAVYSGDGNSQPSTSTTLTQVVNAQPSQVLLTSSHNPATLSQSITYVAAVTGQFGGAPTGSVTLSVNGTAVATSSLSNGQASFTTAFSSLGAETISATYSGDSNNLPGSSTLTQIVNTQQITQIGLTSSLNPAAVGQSVTYHASVTAPTGVPTGNTTFSYAGNPLATIPLSSGEASYIRTLTATGTRSVTATYSGDANNQTSTSPTLNEVVNTQPTQTSVVSSLNPIAVDQPLSFTAVVTGQYGASVAGTVTFRLNGNPIQTVPVTNGQAVLSSTLATVGPQNISAYYSGDGNDQPSTAALSQTVTQQNSQISLTSSASSSSVNQAVTFSAVVAGQYGGTPTGTVVFSISGNNPVTVALVGGQASFSWTFLYAGARTVTASYSGDANDLPAVSAALNQTINP